MALLMSVADVESESELALALESVEQLVWGPHMVMHKLNMDNNKVKVKPKHKEWLDKGSELELEHNIININNIKHNKDPSINKDSNLSCHNNI